MDNLRLELEQSPTRTTNDVWVKSSERMEEHQQRKDSGWSIIDMHHIRASSKASKASIAEEGGRGQEIEFQEISGGPWLEGNNRGGLCA